MFFFKFCFSPNVFEISEAVGNLSISHTLGNVVYVIYDMLICSHMNHKAHMARSFNYLFKNEGLLKVTASHVHCKCGNISKIVLGRVVFTTDH